MKLKHVILIFSLSFLLYPLSFLFADTIIDSVYSVPELDGDMCYTPTGQFHSLNNWTYAMYVGDLSTAASAPANSCIRSFVSFELPEIPEGYEIDSVYIRLYQFDSHGVSPGPIYYDFPYWDIAGGDTVQCIMSHIDYGFELDPGDWEKGDVGNPYTYNHNIGMITDSGLDGYRYLNVTSSVLLDYSIERPLNQYRISFEIDTDWDGLTDKLAFTTGDGVVNYHKPQLFFYLSEIVSLDDNNIELNNSIFHVYPNPISGKGKIMLLSKQSYNVNFNIYNIKGQLVQVVFKGNIEKGENEILFNTKELSNGIYFLKETTNQEKYIKKIIILK
jgi:hypothetical protein